MVRCRAYGARDSFCYVAQPLRAGLTSGAPTALTQRRRGGKPRPYTTRVCPAGPDRKRRERHAATTNQDAGLKPRATKGAERCHSGEWRSRVDGGAGFGCAHLRRTRRQKSKKRTIYRAPTQVGQDAGLKPGATKGVAGLNFDPCCHDSEKFKLTHYRESRYLAFTV